jgi:hypothetical protein
MASSGKPTACGGATRVLLAYNDAHALHDGKMNENAGRMAAITAELHRSGRWDKCEVLETAASADDVVATLHTAQHLATLRTAFADATGWFCQACTLENAAEALRCDMCTTPRSGDADGSGEAKSEYTIPKGARGLSLEGTHTHSEHTLCPPFPACDKAALRPRHLHDEYAGFCGQYSSSSSLSGGRVRKGWHSFRRFV